MAVRNDLILLRSDAGKARTDRTDQDVNPLGALQPAGESVDRVVTAEYDDTSSAQTRTPRRRQRAVRHRRFAN
jgi:hypothetical protein